MTGLRKLRWLFALVPLLAVASLSSAQTRHVPLDEYLAMHDYAEQGYFEGTTTRRPPTSGSTSIRWAVVWRSSAATWAPP
jgi:hypothetical protein